MNLQPWVKVVLCGLVVALVASYSSFRFLNYARGSVISIQTPTNGATVDDGLVEIKGQVDNISYITLNGREIYTTPSGAFSESLLLQPGYNALQVKVQDRFGRVKSKTLQLVYHPDDDAPSDAVILTQKKTETGSAAI